MQVSERSTRSLTITGLDNLPQVSVAFEALPDNAGRVTINIGARMYVGYWPTLGDSAGPASRFLSATPEVLLGLLDPFGTLYRKIDSAAAKATVMAEIERQHTEKVLSDNDALRLTANCERFTPISDINGLQALAGDLMAEVYGNVWMHTHGTVLLGQHPEYVDLQNAIGVIKQVLSAD